MTTENRLLRISSEDRVPGQSRSDFSVIFNNASDTQKVRGIVVKTVNLKHVFPNIFISSDGSTGNNQFVFRRDGSPVNLSVLINPGQYNETQLATALEAVINVGIAPATISISIENDPTSVNFGKYVFTVSAGTLQLVGPDQNSMAEVLGISQDSIFAATVASDQYPNLSGIQKVYICSPELAERHTAASSNNGENVSVIVGIPVKVPFGSEIIYRSNDHLLDRIMFGESKSLNKISVRVCNRVGQILDLQQNDVTIMLKALRVKGAN